MCVFEWECVCVGGGGWGGMAIKVTVIFAYLICNIIYDDDPISSSVIT